MERKKKAFWSWKLAICPSSLDLRLRPHVFELPISPIISLHDKVDAFLWVPTNTNCENAILVNINVGSDTTREPQNCHILHVQYLFFAKGDRALWQLPPLQCLSAEVDKGQTGFWVGSWFFGENRCGTHLEYLPGTSQVWRLCSFSLGERFGVELQVTEAGSRWELLRILTNDRRQNQALN